MAPERLLQKDRGGHGNPKSDIWSLGLIIAELCFGISLWANMKFSQIVRKIVSYCNGEGSVLEKIAREHNCLEQYSKMDEELRIIIESCLSANSSLRPSAAEILRKEIFCKFHEEVQFKVKTKSVVDIPVMERLNLRQVYYLWQLTGKNLQFVQENFMH